MAEKVILKQFKNKAKQPVAGLTPEYAIYDKNGVRLDAKLGNVNLQEFRDLQQQCVNNINAKVTNAINEIDRHIDEIADLTDAELIGSHTEGLTDTNVQEALNEIAHRLKILEEKE